MTNNLVTLARSGSMTEEQYDQERAELRRLYGDSSTEAVAKRDQAMALLFARSGWTQERLAQKERMTRQWVSLRLIFGRFLNFATTVANPETTGKGLTEGRFRTFWQLTDQSETNERKRYMEVLRLMEKNPTTVRRPQIGKPIMEKFADGKWHKPEKIARDLDAAEELVVDTLESMRRMQYYGAKCERRHVGKGSEYRIFKTEKMVSSTELIEKLTPIVRDLKAEGRKNMATMSPATVGYLAGMLEKLLNEWVE